MPTKLVLPLLFVLQDECGATVQEFIQAPLTEYVLGRTVESVETERHDYVYASGQLLREVITTTDAEGNATTEILDFTYDASGSPYTVTRIVGTSSSTYYYMVNAQGDIIRVVNANGATVAEYAYDPWGRVTSASGTMAEANPLRYRGYYYDAEMQFYYLQSRYYNPGVGRFTNADDCETVSFDANTRDSNLFTYCKNDTANDTDETGMFSFNDLFKKISGFLNKLFEKFIERLKNQYQRTKQYIRFSTTLIKVVLDLVLTLVVSRFLKWAIEKVIGFVMKKYIQKSTKSFIQLLGKILSHGATKWLIKKLILRILNLGYRTSITNGIKSVAIDTILSTSTVLSKINSICSACSSITGFIAFVIDLADGKWDDYLTIKLA